MVRQEDQSLKLALGCIATCRPDQLYAGSNQNSTRTEDVVRSVVELCPVCKGSDSVPSTRCVCGGGGGYDEVVYLSPVRWHTPMISKLNKSSQELEATLGYKASTNTLTRVTQREPILKILSFFFKSLSLHKNSL